MSVRANNNTLCISLSLFLFLTRAVLVFATECKNNVDPCLRSQTRVDLYVNVYNNKVMCHLSMKLSDKFEPNQMYTSDKIVVKHISVKETLLKLDLEPKGQGYSKQ